MNEHTINMGAGRTSDERPDITVLDSTQDLMVKMSEGNPGALTVCIEIARAGNILALLHLDDMNIRGSQLWVAWKDFAKKDTQKLIDAATERSEELIEAVNKEIRHTGGFLAVNSGASSKRPAKPKLEEFASL